MSIISLPAQVEQALSRAAVRVAEKLDLPSISSFYAPVPNELNSQLAERLRAQYTSGLYSHQAAAIQAFIDGEDVCLATATASGKSLVFEACAAHLLLQNRQARRTVLALYPARALVHDQMEKWASFCSTLGLNVVRIDGGVSLLARPTLLASADIVAMTPDVAHAWLLGHMSDDANSSFLSRLALVILDEAHVYDGVFGTNMAYFMRRLQAACGQPPRVILATATIGEPSNFAAKLAGKSFVTIDEKMNGAGTCGKTVLLANPSSGCNKKQIPDVLTAISAIDGVRFLAFTDSRIGAEVTASETDSATVKGELGEYLEGEVLTTPYIPSSGILPYRAGYEDVDREAIQRGLLSGSISGVVATSAMELGLDIGQINVGLALNTPYSAKALTQRMGRIGRASYGVFVLLDPEDIVARHGGLSRFLQRKPEPNWLYLDNRFLQYTNALCAADEIRSTGRVSTVPTVMQNLPSEFVAMLRNELQPQEPVPSELLPLKQRAMDSPHNEFPIRNGPATSFQIKAKSHSELRSIGTTTMTQMLREAYPGAIYWYLGIPYKVRQLRLREHEIVAYHTRRASTRPNLQAMAFPQFPSGIHRLWHSDLGFAVECDLQMRERVLGFYERVGRGKPTYSKYEPGSSFYEKPLQQVISTTGFCWYSHIGANEVETAKVVRDVFCAMFGIQAQDIGHSRFFTRRAPSGFGKCYGICVFDSVEGSLRLTERLGLHFADIVREALIVGQNSPLQPVLSELVVFAQSLKQVPLVSDNTGEAVGYDDWIEGIAPGERVTYAPGNAGEAREVLIVELRLAKDGPRYVFEDLSHNGAKYSVPLRAIQADEGTSVGFWNIATGEFEMELPT